MKVNIYVVGLNRADWQEHPNGRAKLHIADAGYAEVDEFNVDELWDLLNWGCWTDEKPKEVEHSPLTHCNADVILNIDGTNVYHCALTCGWHEVTADSLSKVLSYYKVSRRVFGFWPLYEGTNIIM